MKENQVTINELVARILLEFKLVGYADERIYRNYLPRLRMIRKYYEAAGITYYSVAATNEYVKYQEERFSRNEITQTFLRSIRGIASRMNEFYITGTLRIQSGKHGTGEEIELLTILFDEEYSQSEAAKKLGKSPAWIVWKKKAIREKLERARSMANHTS